MGILLGLSAALAWGVGDFFAARLSRLIGTQRAPFYTQSLGVLISILLVLLLSGMIPGASGWAWVGLVGLGVVHALATVLFYRALEIGKVSLTMPITSSFAVVTGVLAYISGERPARLAIFGALLALIGLVLVTAAYEGEAVEEEMGEGEDREERSTPVPGKARNGVPQAVGAALCFGVTFWGLDFLEPMFGAAWLLLMLRLVTLPIVAYLFYRVRHEPVALAAGARRVLWLCAIAVITCDTIAWTAISYGRQMEDVTIVTTLASLYSAVTIFLAWLVWRERLKPLQWLGVAVILLGIVLVGIT